jgi:hypothetical protein
MFFASSGPDCFTMFLIGFFVICFAIERAVKAAAPLVKETAKQGFWWWLNH